MEVEVLSAGQPRPYADSIYKYRITSDKPEQEVKDYCTKVINVCKEGQLEWWEKSYTFVKKGNNEYVYTVTDPFKD